MIDDTVDTDRAKIWPGMQFNVTPCDTEYFFGPSLKERTTATLVYLILPTSTNLKKTCMIAPECQGCLGMFFMPSALSLLYQSL